MFVKNVAFTSLLSERSCFNRITHFFVYLIFFRFKLEFSEFSFKQFEISTINWIWFKDLCLNVQFIPDCNYFAVEYSLRVIISNVSSINWEAKIFEYFLEYLGHQRNAVTNIEIFVFIEKYVFTEASTNNSYGILVYDLLCLIIN